MVACTAPGAGTPHTIAGALFLSSPGAHKRGPQGAAFSGHPASVHGGSARYSTTARDPDSLPRVLCRRLTPQPRAQPTRAGFHGGGQCSVDGSPRCHLVADRTGTYTDYTVYGLRTSEVSMHFCALFYRCGTEPCLLDLLRWLEGCVAHTTSCNFCNSSVRI